MRTVLYRISVIFLFIFLPLVTIAQWKSTFGPDGFALKKIGIGPDFDFSPNNYLPLTAISGLGEDLQLYYYEYPDKNGTQWIKKKMADGIPLDSVEFVQGFTTLLSNRFKIYQNYNSRKDSTFFDLFASLRFKDLQKIRLPNQSKNNILPTLYLQSDTLRFFYPIITSINFIRYFNPIGNTNDFVRACTSSNQRIVSYAHGLVQPSQFTNTIYNMFVTIDSSGIKVPYYFFYDNVSESRYNSIVFRLKLDYNPTGEVISSVLPNSSGTRVDEYTPSFVIFTKDSVFKYESRSYCLRCTTNTDKALDLKSKSKLPFTIEYPNLLAHSRQLICYNNWFSRDTGKTWSQFTLPLNTRINEVKSYDFYYNNRAACFGFATNKGCMFSVDSFRTFRWYSDGIYKASIDDIAISPQGDYYALYTGLLRKNPSGNLTYWTYENTPIDYERFGTATTLFTKGVNIYIGTHTGCIFRLDPSKGTGWDTTLLRQPTSAEPNRAILSFSNINGNIFAGAEDGLLYSADNGATWEERSVSHTHTSSVVLTSSGLVSLVSAKDNAAKAGMYNSTDQGATWTKLPSPLSANVLTMTLFNNTLFVGTDKGMYTTTNLGQTWELSNAGFAQSSDSILSVTSNNKNVFASTTTSIYRFEPSTNRWYGMNAGLTGKTGANRLKANSTILLASIIGESVWKFDLTTVGVEENSFQESYTFTLAPNPAQSFVSLRTDVPECMIERVQITDVLGKVVTTISRNEITTAKEQISIEHLTTGSYVVTMLLNNGTMLSQPLVVSF